MRLDLGKGEKLAVVVKPNDYKSLVLVLSEHVKSYVVKGQGHRFSDVLGMLRDELEELFYVLGASLVQSTIVYVNYNLLKVFILLLPLEETLYRLLIAEILEEDENG